MRKQIAMETQFNLTEIWKKNKFIQTLIKQRYLYILLLPGLIYFLVFRYGPMYGILLAFKKFDPDLGIWASPWIGLKYFQRLFSSDVVYRVVFNTLRISFLKIITGFPAPIILALLLNEIYSNRLKRVIQTISYLPHFLSWVVVSGLIFQILSPSYGIYGLICNVTGIKPGLLLGEPNSFITILVVSDMWKEMGYGSVIYLASISAIGSEMYEAAKIDGASRFKQMRYITLPSLAPTVAVMFVLRLGHVLDAGFDQVFNLYNPLVFGVADIIDTYVYRIGLGNFEYSFSTAVGLSKSVVSFILVMSTKWFVDKFSDRTVW